MKVFSVIFGVPYIFPINSSKVFQVTNLEVFQGFWSILKVLSIYS